MKPRNYYRLGDNNFDDGMANAWAARDIKGLKKLLYVAHNHMGQGKSVGWEAIVQSWERQAVKLKTMIAELEGES